MNPEKISKYAESRGWPRYCVEQIRTGVYKNCAEKWDDITSLPLKMRRELSSFGFSILPFRGRSVLVSSRKDAFRAALELEDGKFIETVLLELKPCDFSVCVSMQVGCPVGCSFCATGRTEFERNLKSEEVFDQVLFWKRYLKKEKSAGEIKNVVFMGMGEPFFNYEAVKKAINILNAKNFFNIGQRRVSVSTFGYVPKIMEFAKDFPQANLAISLHCASDEIRNDLGLMALNCGLPSKDGTGPSKEYRLG